MLFNKKVLWDFKKRKKPVNSGHYVLFATPKCSAFTLLEPTSFGRFDEFKKENKRTLKILESLANPKISFGFAVVFHFEKNEVVFHLNKN